MAEPTPEPNSYLF